MYDMYGVHYRQQIKAKDINIIITSPKDSIKVFYKNMKLFFDFESYKIFHLSD